MSDDTNKMCCASHISYIVHGIHRNAKLFPRCNLASSYSTIITLRVVIVAMRVGLSRDCTCIIFVNYLLSRRFLFAPNATSGVYEWRVAILATHYIVGNNVRAYSTLLSALLNVAWQRSSLCIHKCTRVQMYVCARVCLWRNSGTHYAERANTHVYTTHACGK